MSAITPGPGYPGALDSGKAGASFDSRPAIGTGPITLVAPATNVNGVIVRSWNLAGLTTGKVALVTGSVAPASSFSTNPALLIASDTVQKQLIREIFLPAGQGLWYVTTGASSGEGYGTYDIL